MSCWKASSKNFCLSFSLTWGVWTPPCSAPGTLCACSASNSTKRKKGKFWRWVGRKQKIKLESTWGAWAFTENKQSLHTHPWTKRHTVHQDSDCILLTGESNELWLLHTYKWKRPLISPIILKKCLLLTEMFAFAPKHATILKDIPAKKSVNELKR